MREGKLCGGKLPAFVGAGKCVASLAPWFVRSFHALATHFHYLTYPHIRMPRYVIPKIGKRKTPPIKAGFCLLVCGSSYCVALTIATLTCRAIKLSLPFMLSATACNASSMTGAAEIKRASYSSFLESVSLLILATTSPSLSLIIFAPVLLSSDILQGPLVCLGSCAVCWIIVIKGRCVWIV